MSTYYCKFSQFRNTRLSCFFPLVFATLATLIFFLSISNVCSAQEGSIYYVSPIGSNTNPGTSSQPWQTIAYATGQMIGGDTLILKDGTYYNSNQENQISPPSGSPGNYTIIKAENDFQAIIDCDGYTWANPVDIINKSYIQIEGLKFENSSSYEACIFIDKSNHIKVQRTSIHNGVGSSTDAKYGSPVRIRDSTYVLIEDTFVSGRMRYGIIVREEGNTGLDCEFNILRRCVVRWDMMNTDQPMAAIAIYGTDASDTIENILLQNCIAIDWNPGDYGGKNSIYGGFYCPHVTSEVTWQGCIALNIHGTMSMSNYDQMLCGFMTADDKALNGNRALYNCVAWDTEGSGIWMERGDSMTTTIDQCTVGDSDGNHRDINAAIYDKSLGTSNLTNSMMADNSYANSSIDSSDYNHYWPAGQAQGTNALDTDPSLVYICRTTDAGTGIGGKKRGAVIEKRYGVTGSLWGDTDYNTLSDTDLWPFPNEAQIKVDFSQPNAWQAGMLPDAHDPKRGFCADGTGLYGGPITLTSYIWEYLGNPTPSNIYYNDTESPSVPTNLQATAISSTQINLSWTASTDNVGVSGYRIFRDGVQIITTTNTSYSDMNLSSLTTYAYTVSAYDAAGNDSGLSSQVSATTLPDTTPPTITSVNADGPPTQVIVVFSEPVDESSATDVANYSIDNAITVSTAELGSDLMTVTLTTSEHVDGITYILTANNIEDLASTPNVIAPNTTASYTFVFKLVISNLTVASGRAYDIIDNGLWNGELVYVDRESTYSSVPTWLEGATYIKTANNDNRSNDASFLTFDVNQDVTVYVAHDDRIKTKPFWLTSFADTGEDIVITGTTLSIFASNYLIGTITLGGNEGVGNKSMYSVIIVKYDGGSGECADNDGDGWCIEDGDCDDNDPTINPGITEVCDGVDNNCDGVIDEGCSGGCTDNDRDGWCIEDGDCDDNDRHVNPGHNDAGGRWGTDGVDNDCNGIIDG